jgi:preprotein translocase subunit YajC
MFDQIVYAMGAPGGEGGQQGFGMFIPLILLFGIFYFLLIRPQQKRQKEHKALLSNLKKGDQVITAGGMYGKITGLTDTAVTLEIAEKIRVKVARGQISARLP